MWYKFEEFTERHHFGIAVGFIWVALIASALLTGCSFNGPPNVGITAMDSFPALDSVRLRGRMAYANAAVLGTIVKTDREETYEAMCSVLCHMRGGSEPPRFYYSKIQIDSLIAKRDGTEVKVGGVRWVGWGVRPGDWMPGVGLKALFLIRKHCWEDFGKELAAKTQAGSLFICDTMWSLADLQDVQDTTAFDFVARNRAVLGTRAEEAQP